MLLCCATVTAQSLPRVFALDPAKLHQTKARIAKQNAAVMKALTQLRHDADKAMHEGPFTVTAKQRVPPSGDKHDYLTLAPYWWPDPTKPDGLPYIRRDGETNPESKRDTDNPRLVAMAETVETLAQAYYFTNEAKYAERAALLLRVWFIDKATKMNPHYEYAQAVMGRNNGRGAGLIDARRLIQVVDAVGLLAGSRAWTAQDQQALQAWFRAFVQWLQTSANGKEEVKARNNHGTWFAAELAAFALFIGDEALARQTVEAVKARIAWQIEPDGRQPLELERTRALSYSLFNLQALLTVATMGEKVGVDLWQYEIKDGRSLRRALEYLAPFAFGAKEWPHKQITQWSLEDYFTLLRRAAGKYPDERFRALLAKVPAVNPADRFVLLYAEERKTK
ncbi:MAG TPA: alginate lyase family protein [Blastocatellia bacterium]|nr:alginate lyase family protein [Blastocatellia bacterium]